MPLYYVPQFITTTLNVGGGINASQTTGIILTSVSGIDITKPGILCLTYTDPLNTSNAEWITYTSIDGSNELQGVTRGAEGYSAKSHSNGATIAFPVSKSHINNLADALNTGWVGSEWTWTYASATTFTIAGEDVTAIFRKGTKLRLKQGGSYKYFYVVSSSFSTNTTVTITGGTDYTLANSAITDNDYSYVETPEGFPDWMTYSSTLGGFSGTPTQTARFKIASQQCFVEMDISGTSNATTFTATAPITNAGLPVYIGGLRATDNSAILGGVSNLPVLALPNATTTIEFYQSWAATPWTSSGTKGVTCSFSYRI